MYHYKTHGTCSSEIELEIQNGIITHCKFIGGCKGNTQGLARMVIGCKADEVAQRLEGIPCRGNREHFFSRTACQKKKPPLSFRSSATSGP